MNTPLHDSTTRIQYTIVLLLCSLTLPLRAQTLEYAFKFGSPEGDEAFDIALDANNGLFAAGYFRGTVDFDPGPGVYNLTSQGLDDLFLVKYEADTGNLIWAISAGPRV